jgi:hypothetical protein
MLYQEKSGNPCPGRVLNRGLNVIILTRKLSSLGKSRFRHQYWVTFWKVCQELSAKDSKLDQSLPLLDFTLVREEKMLSNT